VILQDSPAEAQLRREIRQWLASVLPDLPASPPSSDLVARRAFDTAWQQQLWRAGYAAPAWPRQYGGRQATPGEEFVIMEELASAHAPDVGVNFVGLLHAGPTIMTEGSDEQKDRHLQAILSGTHVWCQGFSEPDAGSDLASLRTTATRDGDHYRVSGQKVWTSRAQIADFCELLVRTDQCAPRHRGLTWMILPMDTPGVEIRPLRNLQGDDEFSEVFFDDVIVPAENVVGRENDGWRVAQVTLSFERGTALVSHMIQTRHVVDDVIDAARQARTDSGSAWQDTDVRHTLARIAAELDALWSLAKRNASLAEQGQQIGAGGSILKLRYSEVCQELDVLRLSLIGRAGLTMQNLAAPGELGPVEAALGNLALTIGGGTSNIQRNIIAERLLGLPRDPRP
jgi:alkylation response protein AidB-like acyl-CoA dehydrogenase